MKLYDLQVALKDMIYYGQDSENFSRAQILLGGEEINKYDKLWVHHVNTYSSISKYLQTLFEATYLFLGKPIFQKITHSYIKNHPIKEPVLSKYGESFHLFLRKSMVKKEAVELAFFEWNIAKAFYIPSKELKVSFRKFASYPEEVFADIVLYFQPYVFTFKSQYNIGDIWKKIKYGESLKEESGINNEKSAAYFIIFKDRENTQYKNISLGDFCFLNSLMQKATIEEAYKSVAKYHPDFNFISILESIFHLGFISSIELKNRKKL